MKIISYTIAIFLIFESCNKDVEIVDESKPFYFHYKTGLFWVELTFHDNYYNSFQFPIEGHRFSIPKGEITIDSVGNYYLNYKFELLYDHGYGIPKDTLEKFTLNEKGTFTFTKNYHQRDKSNWNSSDYFTGVIYFNPDNSSTSWSSSYYSSRYNFDLNNTPIRDGELKTHWR
ncbi:hypothetical protein [Carboxylicivirga sp. N1Y90]|uniref:hypothetical protein n=1 Tax=Carboxylicivirga fragile TaxID=3417571 RepID=UPI003D338D68|nr:hypothetical protein [Marinilabiliaceae bacterium N1Y90]